MKVSKTKVEKMVAKYYKGNLIFGKVATEYYQKAQEIFSVKKWEDWEVQMGANHENSENGKSNFFLENVTTFSEVKRYKDIPLKDMDEQEHKDAVENIISQLNQFDVTPVGYEVKRDAVILCWYVLPVLLAFSDYGILLPDHVSEAFGGRVC